MYSALMVAIGELCEKDPPLALSRLSEVREYYQESYNFSMLQGIAELSSGELAKSMKTFGSISSRFPSDPVSRYYLSSLLAKENNRGKALERAVECCELEPENVNYWEHLSRLSERCSDELSKLSILGRSKAELFNRNISCSYKFFVEGNAVIARQACEDALEAIPGCAKVDAVLAEFYDRTNDKELSLEFLSRYCAVRTHDFAVLHRYCLSLIKNKDFVGAEAVCEVLATEDCQSVSFMSAKAIVMHGLGEFKTAQKIFSQALQYEPNNHRLLMMYGNCLKINNSSDECRKVYRKLTQGPARGEAYWGLANLKSGDLNTLDIDTMLSALAESKSERDTIYLNFSLGKAYEDAQNYSRSFKFYRAANERVFRKTPYSIDNYVKFHNQYMEVFRQGVISTSQRNHENTPIFVLGLPRSGSTLIEQILSCHSKVEPTMELNEITRIARLLDRDKETRKPGCFPRVLSNLGAQELYDLGALYVKRTERFRSNKKFFIDKMPENFHHVGFILSAIPNALIIDSRRSLPACGFSIFKQFFSEGYPFAYSLKTIAEYYVEYMRIMDFWKSSFPDRILTVSYEGLVENPGPSIRTLLDFCGLNTEAACLEPHKLERAVATPSAEQVRRPIYTGGKEHWKNYQQYLEPLLV